MALLSFKGIRPTLGPGAWVAGSAEVIGDVVLGEGASVWYQSVLRGDVQPIRIGARTNIQDLSVVHVTSFTHPTTVGEDVTVGHRAILHGCTLGDRVLVGMGAIVMDGVVVGDDCIIGAGALLTPGTQVPPGSMVLGSPGRVKRPLTDEERQFLGLSAAHYVELARKHAASR
ncbi:MAG TPA: gamma carbonic anhydrase family protein [Myxococcaceae bacterium]|nr:gamma carbonic anhydrase family protein [Myxococcaceae bacterium]